MPVDISDYKKNILSIFNDLTEIEIRASLDAGQHNPEHGVMAEIYINAVKRCRQILEIILQEK